MPKLVLRLSGPIAHRNAVALLGLAALLIVARIPMGFLALLALSMAVVVVQGVRPHAAWPTWLRWLLAWCLGASLVSVVLFHTSQLASTSNNFIIMLAICLVGVAVFNGGRTREASDRLVDGLHAGLALTWLISMGEAVTGIKMMDILYPGANTAALVNGHRFYVSAFFPNYNDYSVAMVMLCTIVMARLVFQPAVGTLRTLVRLFMLVTAAFFIVYMGSRGALIGLFLAAVIIVVLSVRTLHRGIVSPRLVVVTALAVVAAAAAVFSSTYVQDRSTATRGTIITNALQLLGDDPMSALLGFGSLPAYQQAAHARFGDILMDPHNLLLELVIWYGIPALVLYLGCWVMVVRRGLVRMDAPMTWRSVSALTVTLMMPVLGVVPSSTLRYHVFWLWLIACAGYLLQGRRRVTNTPPARVTAASPAVTAPTTSA